MNRDIPPSSSTPPDLRKYAARKIIGIYFLSTVSIMVTAITTAITSPFYGIESALYILFIFSPGIVLIFMQLQGFITKQQESLAALSKKPVWPHMAAAAVLMSLLFTSITVGFLFNRFADTAEPEPTRTVIQSKYISYGKGRRTYYNIRIAPPVPSPMPFHLFNTMSLRLTQSDYGRVIEGESEVEILVYKGALGLPWYKRDPHALEIVGATQKDAPPATNQPLPQTIVTDGLMREACNWKKNFDLNREIPNLVPSGYHRDFWPNGAPRSVEPQVNGRNHGMAHYTFANGALYADIPWKDGKKHGVFTLYRDDGTKEQELSYFQGQLFGLQQWFDKSGRLESEYIYIDDNTPLMANRCSGLNTP